MTARIDRPKDRVAEIVIDRAAKRNALDLATIAAVTEAAQSLAGDGALRAVVLRSAGDKAFSAGADIGLLRSLGPESAFDFIDQLRGAIQAVADIPVPVVCRIQGPCIGGAMELAAACDLRIAADAATFCMPEVRVGIPSVIQAALLPRLMGRGRAHWLMLSGEVIDAATAERWGFVEKRVAAAELDTAVDAALASVLASAPAAVRAQKRLFRDWDALPLDRAVSDSMSALARAYEGDEPATYIDKLKRGD